MGCVANSTGIDFCTHAEDAGVRCLTGKISEYIIMSSDKGCLSIYYHTYFLRMFHLWLL